jgi:hypothetical protein
MLHVQRLSVYVGGNTGILETRTLVDRSRRNNICRMRFFIRIRRL